MPLEPERVGLLFVHGIGEQARWDHLRASALELAELLRQRGDACTVTVADRTGEWQLPPGGPHPEALSPLTLTYASADRQIEFECDEVWWADLGTRSGLNDTITFWLWGLGQWSAPIYRELSGAGLPSDTDLVRMPVSVAGHPWQEPVARLQLLLAAVATVFVVCTWSLAKRVAGALLGATPLPTLIVRYVGDVRTYEARAAPGDAALSDPGHPRRVSIRRRMIAQMVGMGARRDLSRWYVLAHSLGTVVAYNGLTETGQALPNYLSREQWQQLPEDLKRDEGCKIRDDVHAMMPSRAPWLAKSDVINRPLLFERLTGFLSYGSPLGKFAALWPQIVATATDRRDGRKPLAGCEWLNLVAPTDPVAGKLDSFKVARLDGAIPAVRDIHVAWSWAFGLAHILYFRGFERFRREETGPAQRRAVAGWLVDRQLPAKDAEPGFSRRLMAWAVYALILVLLWLVATLLVALVDSGMDSLLGGQIEAWGSWQHTAIGFARLASTVMGGVLSLILLAGVYRWARESNLNARLAEYDRKDEAVVAMLRRQRALARVLGTIGCFLVILGLTIDLDQLHRFAVSVPIWLESVRGLVTLAASVVGTGAVAWGQTLVNYASRQPGRSPN